MFALIGYGNDTAYSSYRFRTHKFRGRGGFAFPDGPVGNTAGPDVSVMAARPWAGQESRGSAAGSRRLG